jgi:hypothetical protein
MRVDDVAGNECRALHNGCNALCHLMSEAARMGLKAADLAERLSVMGFRDTSQAALAALYSEAGTDFAVFQGTSNCGQRVSNLRP